MRRKVVLVPSMLLVLALFFSAWVVRSTIIKVDQCAQWVCPQVAAGQMSFWTALFVWGCYCEGNGGTDSAKGKRASAYQPATGPTCAAAQIKVIGSAH